MRLSIKSTVLAASLVASLGAFAQTTAPAAPASAPAGMKMQRAERFSPEQRQQRMAERSAEQAKTLGITAQQRPQWDAYVQARHAMMQPMNGADPAQHQAERERVMATNAAQRAQFMADRMQEHAKKAQDFATATKNLRNSLTAAQQTQFDQMGGFRGGDKRGGPRGGMMQQGGGMRGGMMPPPNGKPADLQTAPAQAKPAAR